MWGTLHGKMKLSKLKKKLQTYVVLTIIIILLLSNELKKYYNKDFLFSKRKMRSKACLGT